MSQTTDTVATEGAVFLSYAREDLEAAQRLATELRASGIEVWFDQSELQGGDAWDRKIREEIDSCALFVPIISKNTEARSKGYFRLEWKLAVDQTHMLKEGIPFLVPVVLADTPEPISGVPAEFRKVHWTRLSPDNPAPAFAAQIKRLLEARRQPATPSARTPAPKVSPSAASGSSHRTPWALLLGLGVVASLGTGAFLYLRQSNTTPKVAAVQPPQPVSEKSIAVLPFENLSDDKGNLFFTDGIHEDILTDLALLHDLRVISRTSVMQYRQTTKTISEIGSELHVAYILEGGVQRSGTRIRVTSQLIDSRTDVQVWAKAYDRDITDIFAIQSEISQEIASSLAAVLSPQEKILLQRRPTDNVAAYDAFLRGRAVLNRWLNSNLDALKEAEVQFTAAVNADPKFSEAWGELAHVHSMFAFRGFDQSDKRIAMADDAINRALKLAPESPDVARALADYSYYAHRDYQGASAQYEKIVRSSPNDSNAHFMLGLISRRQGRWPQSLAELRTAFSLDPRNTLYLRVLVQDLRYARRWDEAIKAQKELIQLAGALQLTERIVLAYICVGATGSLAECDSLVASLSPDELNSPLLVNFRMMVASWKDDYAEFKRLDASLPTFSEGYDEPVVRALQVAWVYAEHGDLETARRKISGFERDYKDRVAREPNNAELYMKLARIEALEGKKEDALRDARRAVELLPESADALQGVEIAYMAAGVAAWLGERDVALKELTHLITCPFGLDAFSLRHDPAFSRLRGDPAFDAFVNDPRNFRPLF